MEDQHTEMVVAHDRAMHTATCGYKVTVTGLRGWIVEVCLSSCLLVCLSPCICVSVIISPSVRGSASLIEDQHTVTVVARDRALHTATCSFKVTVTGQWEWIVDGLPVQVSASLSTGICVCVCDHLT